jgi:UDPglucose 6-dehydrogenase
VNKSTVPVGTGKKTKAALKEALKRRGAEFSFDIVSNPEFLREGSAVDDFMRPDRIVIGCDSPTAKDIMTEIYRVLYINNHPFCITDIETAELIKYAANAFLATKITFINEISALCEAAGANVQQVSAALGLDKRIGRFFLHAGPGYGGSCFPKDTRALVNIAKTYDVDMTIVDTVIRANERQKLRMADKILSKMPEISGKTVAVLGLAFKPETDDLREAPSLTVIAELLKHGAKIKVYDPVAMDNARRYALLGGQITYCENEYDAMADSDAIVIITEWNQFRSLDFEKIKAVADAKYFFDFRNIYDRKTIEGHGFIYEGVGV